MIPDGWTGPQVGVRQRGRDRCLAPFEFGSSSVTLPPVALPSDFEIEWIADWWEPGKITNEIGLAVGPVRADISGHSSYYRVSMTGLDSRIIKQRDDFRGVRTRFLLQKEGSVVKFYGNGKQLGITRIDRFDELRTKTVAPTIDFFSVAFCLHEVTIREL